VNAVWLPKEAGALAFAGSILLGLSASRMWLEVDAIDFALAVVATPFRAV